MRCLSLGRAGLVFFVAILEVYSVDLERLESLGPTVTYGKHSWFMNLPGLTADRTPVCVFSSLAWLGAWRRQD
jgi:hypothetical protein